MQFLDPLSPTLLPCSRTLAKNMFLSCIEFDMIHHSVQLTTLRSHFGSSETFPLKFPRGLAFWFVRVPSGPAKTRSNGSSCWWWERQWQLLGAASTEDADPHRVPSSWLHGQMPAQQPPPQIQERPSHVSVPRMQSEVQDTSWSRTRRHRHAYQG